MKQRFLVLGVLAGILASNPAFGSSRKKAPPRPQNQPPIIASVTANTITVTENKVTRTFTITQFTEINVNGRRATVSDLKPGMTVSVTLGTDPSKASRISAMGK